MRLIAERLLPGVEGLTYVDRELISQVQLPLPPPQKTHRHHIYCSDANDGARELICEVAAARGLLLVENTDHKARQRLGVCAFASHMKKGAQQVTAATGRATLPAVPSRRIRKDADDKSAAPRGNPLHLTCTDRDLQFCDHMLLYLNGRTWTRGEQSVKLADELLRALDMEVHVLLAHEMPSLEQRGGGDQDKHAACEFQALFASANGATPKELIQRNIYGEIAIALKAGPWREVSMVLMAAALTAGESSSKKKTRTGTVSSSARIKTCQVGHQHTQPSESERERASANATTRSDRQITTRARRLWRTAAASRLEAPTISSARATAAEPSIAPSQSAVEVEAAVLGESPGMEIELEI